MEYLDFHGDGSWGAPWAGFSQELCPSVSHCSESPHHLSGTSIALFLLKPVLWQWLLVLIRETTFLFQNWWSVPAQSKETCFAVRLLETILHSILPGLNFYCPLRFDISFSTGLSGGGRHSLSPQNFCNRSSALSFPLLGPTWFPCLHICVICR